MSVIGIDPGKLGGLAHLDDDGTLLAILPTPMVKAGKSTKSDWYDVAAIRRFLLEARDRDQARAAALFVLVERSDFVGGMGAKGGKDAIRGGAANYHRGVSRGLWEGILGALELSHDFVLARVWQKEMHAGDVKAKGETKKRSVLAVQRLFPGADLKRTRRSLGPDHNLADAVLIASFARRHHHAPRKPATSTKASASKKTAATAIAGPAAGVSAVGAAVHHPKHGPGTIKTVATSTAQVVFVSGGTKRVPLEQLRAVDPRAIAVGILQTLGVIQKRISSAIAAHQAATAAAHA